MSSRLTDFDSADRIFLLRIVTAVTSVATGMAALVAYYLVETRGIGRWSVVGVVLLGAMIGVGFSFVATWLLGQASNRFVATVTGAGNLPPAPSFSYQESLAARGRYQEAADSFRLHLAEHPADHDARMGLAAILAGRLGDPGGAVTIYHEIRSARPGPAWEYRASQALIDLHRASRNQGQLLAELARFADRYRGSPAGKAAKRELLAIKAAKGSDPA